MTEYSIRRPLERPPIHPVEILREDVLPALGLSVSEAARRLGVSRQQLHRVLACTHPITTQMALRLGKFAGNGPALWLRLQQAYDLWHTERRMKSELTKIEPEKKPAIGIKKSPKKKLIKRPDYSTRPSRLVPIALRVNRFPLSRILWYCDGD
jgi:addiction module HigA family antidote